MKNEIPLSEYLRGKTQTLVAEALGITQGAVSQMILSGRDIRIIEHKDGTIEAVERKQIRSPKNAAA